MQLFADHGSVDRRARAILVGIITAAAIWFAWGAWQPLPVIQDEYSYVLQSEIFARGHWTEPPPPVQYPFQQPHVLTSPRLASKYPPGHALLMTPGTLVGAPWLIPLVLSAFAGALVFLLIENFYGVGCALFGWACWLSDSINLRFRPGYYSENTSGLAWLLVWWFLLRWRRSPNAKDLVFVSIALGWCAITRPLTAVAFAIPVAVAVLPRVVEQRRWRDLGFAVVAGALVVAILPLANWRTTGNPLKSAFGLYRDQYLPHDRLGFGLDSTPPLEPLTPVNADVYVELAQIHRLHTLRTLPRVIYERVAELSAVEWHAWRMALIPLGIVGLTAATAELWFALACGVVLFLVYLLWAHWHGWTVYYFEAVPALAFLYAAGLHRIGRWLRARRPQAVRYATIFAALVTTVYAADALRIWHNTHNELADYDTKFHALMDSIPFQGAVIFVRYQPGKHPHTTVVRNSVSLARDRFWIVNDDSSANMTILRAADGRVPMLYQEKGSLLTVYRTLLDSLRLEESAAGSK
jgi:hypothetical protein